MTHLTIKGEDLLMYMPELLSTIGLLMDIGGVVLVWKFGVPGPMKAEWTKHIVTLGASQPTPRQAQLNKFMSIAGAWLVIAGFTVQIIANWV